MAKKPCNCKWCGKITDKQHTKECDGCWELRSRIERNPDLAIIMLNKMGFINKERSDRNGNDDREKDQDNQAKQ
jgi:hypothetical protein